MTRIAACSCAQLTVACDGEPGIVSLCHCRECQKRTGSAFGIGAYFPRDAVRPTGPARRYTRPSDSGFPVTFHFCPNCGSTVFWEAARLPDLVGVAVGCFADPAFPPPRQAVYAHHSHPWLSLSL